MPAIENGFGADGDLANQSFARYAIQTVSDFRARMIVGPAAIRSIVVSAQMVGAGGGTLAPTAAFTAGMFRLIVVRGTTQVDRNAAITGYDVLSGIGNILFSRLVPANNQDGVFQFTEKELACGKGEYLTVLAFGVVDNLGGYQISAVTLTVLGHPTGIDGDNNSKVQLR